MRSRDSRCPETHERVGGRRDAGGDRRHQEDRNGADDRGRYRDSDRGCDVDPRGDRGRAREDYGSSERADVGGKLSRRSNSVDPPRSPGKGEQQKPESLKDGDDEITIEITDGVTRVTGDVTYQVQMYVPREGGAQKLRDGQKPQTVCIRGPSRVDKTTAEEDAQRLKKAFLEGGIQKVRKVRAALTGRGGYDIA